MCVPEVTGITNAENAKNNTGDTKNGESNQETHAPFLVLRFVDGIAGEHGEAPYYTQDEVERKESEESKAGEQHYIA